MGYVLRRVVAVVPIWWVVASIVFVLVRLVPGDPVLLIAGTDASAEQVRDIRSSLGLVRAAAPWGHGALALFARARHARPPRSGACLPSARAVRHAGVGADCHSG